MRPCTFGNDTQNVDDGLWYFAFNWVRVGSGELADRRKGSVSKSVTLVCAAPINAQVLGSLYFALLVVFNFARKSNEATVRSENGVAKMFLFVLFTPYRGWHLTSVFSEGVQYRSENRDKSSHTCIIVWLQPQGDFYSTLFSILSLMAASSCCFWFFTLYLFIW